MELKELQKKVIKFRDARDWAQYHNPKDLAISLSLEAAELLEVFQWKDPQEVEATKSDPESRRRVKEELGDILIYALNMCHAFGFDPSEVILEKLEINEKKYPVEREKSSAERDTKY
jgi:NTP pyrophosphatase (non-canonical NTP hydrolase)